jgi:hypothetical protein
VKISTEHRDALNEALDETAGYEGDVYVFDVKHIEILRSAVIAMLEDDEQIATVAPAVDAPTDDWDTERLDAAIRDYATVVRMAQLPQHGGMQRELRQTRLRIHEIAKSVFASSPKPAVDAQPVATKEPAHKFAIIRDRNYDGEGLSLWTWDGEYYVGADGDCLSPDPDGTLDGYTAEWLTDYQLETRLNDSSAQSEGLRKDTWQPIEKAPKDGTEVLLIATRHSMLMPHPERIVGAYRNGWWSGPSTLSHVTHWMPLPEAPAALSQKDPQ